MNLDIWIFVRVMVILEDLSNIKQASSSDSAKLYEFWRQEWAEIDQKLTELAETDFDAYSNMMMNTQIMLDLPEQHQKAFQKTLEDLIAQLQTKRSTSKDSEFQKDLKFEIDSLKTFLEF